MMSDAIKVEFLQPIYDEDFPARGMKAWLVKWEWHDDYECYRLHFDFSQFESENDQYFQEVYYPNKRTAALPYEKEHYTAKEAGYYEPLYWTYYSTPAGDGMIASRNDAEMLRTLFKTYLRKID